MRGRGSQHVLEVGVHPLGVLWVPRPDGDVIGLLRADGVIEVEVRGIDRVLGGPDQVDHSVGDVLEVLELRAVNGLRRAAVKRVGQGGPVLQGRHQGKGLVGGSCLGDGGGGGVDLVGQEVRPAVEGQYAAVRGVHGHQRHLEVARVARRQGLDGGDRRVLVLLADRGDDLVAAGVDLVVGQLGAVPELGAHHLQQVAVGAAVGLGLGVLDRGGEDGGGALLLGNVAVLGHELQHPRPAVLGSLRADGGVVGAGGGQDPGQEGGLGDGQARRALPEERLGGRVDTVGPAPEVHRVEVGVENLLLGLGVVDLDRHNGLLELTRVGSRGIHVVVLDVLLGKCRGTLLGAAGEVVPQRPDNTLGVNALVAVEGAVLTGHDGVAHVVRQGGGVDNVAVHLGEPAHLRGAVVVVHDRGGGQGELGDVGDLDHRVGGNEAAEEQGDHEQEGAQHEPPAGHPAPDRPLARPRVVEEATPPSGAGPLGVLAAPGWSPGGPGLLLGLPDSGLDRRRLGQLARAPGSRRIASSHVVLVSVDWGCGARAAHPRFHHQYHHRNHRDR